MVDYDYNGGNVTKFKIVIADWGSAFVGRYSGVFLGGTPVYAGPRTFDSLDKDLFSFGRLAVELMMKKSGKESKL